MMILMSLVVIVALWLLLLTMMTMVIVGVAVEGSWMMMLLLLLVVLVWWLLLLVRWWLVTVHHNITVTLELLTDLAIDKLEERVLIHLIVEVVGQICVLIKPGSWHFQLVCEVVPRVQHLLVRLLLLRSLHHFKIG